MVDSSMNRAELRQYRTKQARIRRRQFIEEAIRLRQFTPSQTLEMWLDFMGFIEKLGMGTTDEQD